MHFERTELLPDAQGQGLSVDLGSLIKGGWVEKRRELREGGTEGQLAACRGSPG